MEGSFWEDVSDSNIIPGILLAAVIAVVLVGVDYMAGGQVLCKYLFFA